jgi:hypothetical protein
MKLYINKMNIFGHIFILLTLHFQSLKGFLLKRYVKDFKVILEIKSKLVLIA